MYRVLSTLFLVVGLALFGAYAVAQVKGALEVSAVRLSNVAP
jgi:hypothetical protein